MFSSDVGYMHAKLSAQIDRGLEVQACLKWCASRGMSVYKGDYSVSEHLDKHIKPGT